MSEQTPKSLSRRQLLRLFASGGAVVASGAVLAACGGQSTTTTSDAATSVPSSGEATSSASTDNTAATTVPATSAPATLEQATLKIMMLGQRPSNFDEVIAEAESRMKDTVNAKLDVTFVPASDRNKLSITLQAGEALDLMFDAPWLSINQNIAQGFYAPLDELLPKYAPTVVSNRPQVMWDANKFLDTIYGVPLGVYHFSGRQWLIRKDIREELGIGPIQSVSDLEKYLYTGKEKKPNMVGFSSGLEVAGQLFWADFDTSVRPFGDEDWLLYATNNDGAVHNFLKERDEVMWNDLQLMRKWYNDGIIAKDVLAAQNTYALESGKSLAEPTNDYVYSPAKYEAVKNMGGDLESVNFYDKSKKRVINFRQWNFICVPEVSTNKERALTFLEWANQQDNYDLLAYGIKGKNWEDAGPGLYKPLAEAYPYFPYSWIWNPVNERENANLPQEGLEWNQWARNADNFTADKLLGFTVDNEPILDQKSALNSIRTEFWKPITVGAADPEEAFTSLTNKGGAFYDQVQEEYTKQAEAFLAKKG